MKNWTRIFALLLSGLMAITSMTACNQKAKVEDGDDGKSYTNLSPEQVYEALLNADHARYTMDRIVITAEDRMQDTTIDEKDGDVRSNKWSHTSKSSPEANFSNNIIITDSNNGFDYYRSGDNASWIRRKLSDDLGWKSKIETLFPSCCGSLFTDDGNLEKVASNRYKVRDDVMADFIAADEDKVLNREFGDLPYTVEAYMESAGTTYTIYVTAETLDGSVRIENKAVVEFTDIKIEIPTTYEIEERS